MLRKGSNNRNDESPSAGSPSPFFVFPGVILREDGWLITQDTYKGNTWEPRTQNLYVYVGNNPINYVDPTGHRWDDQEPGEYQDWLKQQKALKAVATEPRQAITAATSEELPSGSITVLVCPTCVGLGDNVAAGHIALVWAQGKTVGYFSFATKGGDSSLSTVPGAMVTANLTSSPNDLQGMMNEINQNIRQKTGAGPYEWALQIPNIPAEKMQAGLQYLTSTMDHDYNVVTYNCLSAVDNTLDAAGVPNPEQTAFPVPVGWFWTMMSQNHEYPRVYK